MDVGNDQAMKHDLNGPSAMYRRVLCPGSASIEKDIPEISTTDADEGTRLHNLMEWVGRQVIDGVSIPDIFSEIDDDDVDLLDFCLRKVKEFLTVKDTAHYFETWLQHSDPDIDGGTADYIWIENSTAFVTDYKFGWLPLKTKAVLLQLSHYAILVFEKFKDVENVSIQAIQARTRQTFTRMWTRSDLPIITRAVIDASCATRKPRPWTRLYPSRDACENCKGALSGSCPAFKSEARALTLAGAGAALEIHDLERWIEFGPILTKAYDHAKYAAKKLMRGGVEFNKYELKTRKAKATIKDVVRFVAMAKAYDVTQEDLLPLMSIGKTDALKLLTKAIQQSKGGTLKDAEKRFFEVFDSCIVRGDPVEYITRKK